MQPRNNQLEKAFNQSMSSENTRCCVCSMMESPNPFSNFRRGKLDAALSKLDSEPQSPLTVVVQRSKVTLPTSVLSVSAENDSKPITCSECGICVHKCKL